MVKRCLAMLIAVVLAAVVAGAIYQAALDLSEVKMDSAAIRAAAETIPAPTRVSPWWWLLPPVAYVNTATAAAHTPDRLQLLRGLHDPQPSPRRPLGIILVRSRNTEHSHHRVADELLNRVGSNT